jgi:hypothetical protein
VTGAAIIATPPPGIESKYSFVCRFMEDNRLQRLKEAMVTINIIFDVNIDSEKKRCLIIYISF